MFKSKDFSLTQTTDTFETSMFTLTGGTCKSGTLWCCSPKRLCNFYRINILLVLVCIKFSIKWKWRSVIWLPANTKMVCSSSELAGKRIRNLTSKAMALNRKRMECPLRIYCPFSESCRKVRGNWSRWLTDWCSADSDAGAVVKRQPSVKAKLLIYFSITLNDWTYQKAFPGSAHTQYRWLCPDSFWPPEYNCHYCGVLGF